MTARPVTLRDVHTTQLNDRTSQYDGLNCTCAAGAAAIKWHYRDERPSPDPRVIWPVTAGIVRAFCRDDDNTRDTEGGTNLLQIQDALWRGWRVRAAVLTNGSFDHLWEMAQDEENIVIVQYQYSVLHGTRWASSETFMGAHGSSIAAATSDKCQFSDPLADGRRRGIPEGVQILDRHYLREACGRLVVDRRTGQRRGLGRANFAVVRRQPVLEPPDPVDEGEVMDNLAPSASFRDVILKAGTILYKDSALTTRHSSVTHDTPLGFLGATATAYRVANAGNSNWIKRDGQEIVENERVYE